MNDKSNILRRDSCPSCDVYPPCVNKAMVSLEHMKQILSENVSSDSSLKSSKTVDSVLHLIKRLETDWKDYEERIVSEREKIFHYTSRIEKLSLIRLEQLPQFVQNEHLRASANLNELDWHLNYTQSQLDKARKRHAYVEKLHAKILNELLNIQDYKPLVDDKLASESQILDQIAKDKEKTRLLLSQARQKLKDTEIKKEEAIRSSQRERLRFKNELKRANRILNELRVELEEGRLFEEQTTEEIKKVNDALGILLLQLGDLKKSLSVLQEKWDQLREKTDSLSASWTELSEEHEKLDGINRKLNESMTSIRDQQMEKQNLIKEKVNKVEDAFKKSRRKNKETEMDTEDMSAKIIKCQDSIVKFGSQMEQDADQLVEIKIEFDDLLLTMSETKAQFEALNQKMKNKEMKQMDVEAKQIHVKELLENQINTDQILKKSMNDRTSSGTVQLEEEKKEASRKRVKSRKALNELQEVLKIEREDIAEIRLKAKNSNEMLKAMKQELQQMKDELNDLQGKFESETESLNENYKKTETSLTGLERRLEYMMWRKSTMNKKLEEIEFYMAAVNRGMRPIENDINTLSDELTELNLQKEMKVRKEGKLKISTDSTLSRITANQKGHLEIISQRKVFLKSLEDKTVCEKRSNERLASNYRNLQNELLELKEKYLDMLATSNQKDADIVDIKQILKLRAHASHKELSLLKVQESYHQVLFNQCQEDSFKTRHLISALTKTLNNSISSVICLSSRE